MCSSITKCSYRLEGYTGGVRRLSTIPVTVLFQLFYLLVLNARRMVVLYPANCQIVRMIFVEVLYYYFVYFTCV